MSNLSPLQIAATAIAEALGSSCKIPDDCGSFKCNFPSILQSERMHDLRIFWEPTRDSLLLTLSSAFDLSPLQQGGHLRRTLEKSIRPFLQEHYEGKGRLLLVRQPNGELNPFVETRIDYAPLIDDEEIEEEFNAAFVRSFFTLEILGPVFDRIELGYLPDSYERMGSMMIAYGFWETETSVEFSGPTTRLPPGLFGGVKELRMQ